MTVTCPQCQIAYDDTYRLTYCPHARFEMNTTVCSGGRFLGVAHSIEEMNRLYAEDARQSYGKRLFP